LPKSNQVYINFASILSKFHFNIAQILTKSKQICPNLTNFAQKILLRDTATLPAPTALMVRVLPLKRFYKLLPACLSKFFTVLNLILKIEQKKIGQQHETTFKAGSIQSSDDKVIKIAVVPLFLFCILMTRLKPRSHVLILY